MFFDTTYQVADIKVNTNEQQQAITLIFMTGMIIPGPDGNSASILPAGYIRIPVGKDEALKLGAAIIEHADELPDDSKIAVVTDMSEARKAAEMDKAIRANAS